MKNLDLKLSITYHGIDIQSQFENISSIEELNLAIAKYIHRVYEYVVPELEEQSDMA